MLRVKNVAFIVFCVGIYHFTAFCCEKQLIEMLFNCANETNK